MQWSRDVVKFATKGEIIGPPYNWTATGVCIDSRSVRPGDLFVAIVGERTDGHGYVVDAYDKGAVAAVVSRVDVCSRVGGKVYAGGSNSDIIAASSATHNGVDLVNHGATPNCSAKTKDNASTSCSRLTTTKYDVSITTGRATPNCEFTMNHDATNNMSDSKTTGDLLEETKHTAHENTHQIPLILAKDTFNALVDLAVYVRHNHPDTKYIGVTGSVGKTTVKEMLGLALSRYGETYVTPGNHNNHYGVPLTLANMPPHTQYAVIEMGMDHAGDIAKLTSIVQPHVAVVINVRPAHIGNFGSIQEIADAKAEIFLGLQHGGTAVLNRDCDFYDHLRSTLEELEFKENIDNIPCPQPPVESIPISEKRRRNFRNFSDSNDDRFEQISLHGYTNLTKCYLTTRKSNVVSFGKHEKATVSLQKLDITTKHSLTVINNIAVRIDNKKTVIYSLTIPGEHQVTNSLCVIAVLHSLGLDAQSGADSLASFKSVKGRGQMSRDVTTLHGVKVTVIDDSYNANPSSMSAALTTLASLPHPHGRKVAVLGDMLFLGDQARTYHEELVPQILDAGVEVLYTIGENMGYMGANSLGSIKRQHFGDTAELLCVAMGLFQDGDLVLVKGSNAMGTSRVVEYLAGQP